MRGGADAGGPPRQHVGAAGTEARHRSDAGGGVPARGGATVGDLVAEVAATLAASGVPLAREEARDLLAALLDVPRFWPTLNRHAPAEPALAADARVAAARRARGAPFAYAVGRAAFRHLTLDVDPRVLIPRQETEVLVDEVLQAFEGEPAPWGACVDVGTGSGAIALALASEGWFDRVVAVDVSLDALAVARRNAELCAPVLRVPVELRHGSLLAPVRELRARCVVSNPPYIAHDEAAALPASVRDWEPAVALFAAQEGMAAIAGLVREAAHVLEPGGLLAMEVDARRAGLAAELAASHGAYHAVQVRLDLAGRERIVLARRRRN